MRKYTLAILPLSIFSAICFAADVGSTCAIKECAAGDQAKTYFKNSDPYYACETKELGEYTNFVIGMVSLSLQLTGKAPNISAKTGEPEYLDTANGPNQTRLMLDAMRTKAGVKTFDQAMARCTLGAPNLKVSIMNSPKDSQEIWVSSNKTKQSFWMPKSHLEKR
jgi:hypothetical protein